MIDPGRLGYRDQVRLFHDADVVVGEHGANLTGVGFCRPGGLVVELFQPIQHTLFYVSLAEVTGLVHRSLIGRDEGEERWSLDADEAVRLTLDAMGAARSFA